MSKHEKQVRRERRKDDRSRRQRARRHPLSSPLRGSHIRHGAAAIAAAAVMAAGTQAYASVVRFDNPAHGDAGHFHWASPDAFDPALDVTLPAGAQPGSAYDLTVMSQDVESPDISKFKSYYPSTGMRLQVDSLSPSYGLGLQLNSGDPVPFPSGVYDGYSQLAFAAEGYLNYYGSLPENQTVYFGLQIGGAYAQYYGTAQFGWIAGFRTGADFELTAWGYETDIGVPIAAGVPEPGSLALLAVGAAGLSATRRKRCRD